MSKQLTPAQLEKLAPIAANMAQAIVVGSLRYPGQSAVETLRKTWAELTGNNYPWREGCADCIIGLLRDLGGVYFQQTGIDPRSLCQKKVYYYNEKTDRLEEKKPEAHKAPEKPAPVSAEKAEAPKPKAAPKKTTTASKGAKTAKK